MLWLTASLTLVILPHIFRLPAWIGLSFFVLVFWRLANVIKGIQVPTAWFRLPLSLGALIGVYLSYGSLLGLNAGVALLAVLTGLKLLEAKGLRDAYALSFLGLFLIVTNFLFSQSIPTGIYMLVVAFGFTATLIAISTPTGDLSISQRCRLATSLLLQSLPLMLVLFVLFPRIAGPLWALPKDAMSGLSGLSESMSPGNISELGLSTNVAFRVKFDGEPPPPAQRYWRGPVLWASDGRTWTANTSEVKPRLSLMEAKDDPVDYTITLEPHYRRWLFALDIPSTVPLGGLMTDDFQLLARRPVRKRWTYRVRSYPKYRINYLSPAQRRQMLQLPRGFHPKTRALAAKWRDELATEEAIIRRALDYFRTQAFFYTLKPPLLKGDPVDEFLFHARRGFCEHYAAAFTVLMRAAGIPARVVTGYQGGEMNPLGDYLIVRQRDAHAWVEIWRRVQGWVRVDPTAAVSPDRIEVGLEAAIPSSVGPAGFRLQPNSTMQTIWRTVHHGWDSINHAWHDWVVNYNAGRQHHLLTRLGVEAGNWLYLALGIFLATAGALLSVGFWLLLRSPPTDPVSRTYRRFCRKLARYGFPRHPSEGPLDFATRVCSQRPHLAEPVQAITALYIRLRYESPVIKASELKQLQKAAAAFRP